MQSIQLLAAAKQASEQNRWRDAEELVIQAAEQEPQNPQPRLVLGIVRYNLGELPGALEAFNQAITLDPQSFVALNWAGMLAQTLGDFESATEFCQAAIRIQPADPEPHFNLGITYARMGRLEDSVAPLKRAVKLQPRPNFQYALASAFLHLNRRAEAVDLLKQAVRSQPTETGFVDLMDAQIKIGRPDDALRTGEQGTRIYPASAQIEVMISRAFAELGDQEQSEHHLETAHRYAPEQAEYYMLKAKRAQHLGHFEEAERLLRQAIALAPLLGHPYLSIVSSRNVVPEDAVLIAQIERVAQDPAVHPSQRAPLLYAIAKAYDNLGNFSKANDYYQDANAAQKQYALRSRPFDAEKLEFQVGQRIKHYNAELFASVRENANRSNIPIIVAGMMRSGTTLVEQILSAHAQIGGAGELSFWASREDWYFDYARGELDLAAIAKAGFEYVELLQSKVPGFARVTDKNPANIMCLGLIHAALPNSKIVHTVRDPVDTALSIWLTPVDNPPSFCCDRNNIVTMLRAYKKLAAHWRNVIPSSNYFELSYERLTSDPETVMRALLEFLELEWDENCLHPERNQRSVSTPSLWQVRQPLYKTSVARWKAYEQWIPEFLSLHNDSISRKYP